MLIAVTVHVFGISMLALAIQSFFETATLAGTARFRMSVQTPPYLLDAVLQWRIPASKVPRSDPTVLLNMFSLPPKV
jgi:hypothetical protein